MKRVIVIIFITLLSVVLYQNLKYKTIQTTSDIDKLLHQKVTKEYLTDKIVYALKKDDIQTAKELQNLSYMLNIKLPKKLIEKIQEQDSLANKLSDFAQGFFSGDAKNQNQLIGAISSDMTLYGDLRDIKKEATNYLHNKPYDEFILGISTLGVGLSLTTFFTAGSTSTLKVGTSILKLAKKTGKLTKSFSKYLLQKLSKTYDKRIFKSVDFTDYKSIKSALKTIDFTPLKTPLTKLSKINQNTSLDTTLYLLKYINNEKDLTKVAKISQKYKKNTKIIFKILGKNALRATKQILYFSKTAIYVTLMLLLTVLFLL